MFLGRFQRLRFLVFELPVVAFGRLIFRVGMGFAEGLLKIIGAIGQPRVEDASEIRSLVHFPRDDVIVRKRDNLMIEEPGQRP